MTLSFSLGPLGRARNMPAASLFADRAVTSPIATPLAYRIAQGVALACLAAVAVSLAGDSDLALTYAVSVIAAFFLLRLVALAIMWMARHSGTIRGTTLRLAVHNIHRPGALTPSVVLSLGLGLSLLVGLALIDSNLRGQLSGTIAEKAPDFFFLDVQNRERDAFVALVSRVAPEGELETVPMLRGRFVAIKDVPAGAVRPGEGAGWALRGDRGVTYSETVPANSTLTAGEWWPPGYDGEPLVSLEAEIAEGLGVTVGDTITVNVLGRNMTARVANLRRLEWESLSINFVMVFSPNTFRGAPHAHLATLKLPEGGDRSKEREVLSAVTRAFPGVTSISVRDAIDSVNALISRHCARRPRGGLAGALRLHAGARRGARRRPPPAPPGRGDPEDARRYAQPAAQRLFAGIRASRHRHRAVCRRGGNGRRLVRGGARDGARIQLRALGRADGGCACAGGDARPWPCRNVANPFREARRAP